MCRLQGKQPPHGFEAGAGCGVVVDSDRQRLAIEDLVEVQPIDISEQRLLCRPRSRQLTIDGANDNDEVEVSARKFGQRHQFDGVVVDVGVVVEPWLLRQFVLDQTHQREQLDRRRPIADARSTGTEADNDLEDFAAAETFAFVNELARQ